APREFGPRVQKTLAHLGASPAELVAAVESVAQLLRETIDLTDGLYRPLAVAGMEGSAGLAAYTNVPADPGVRQATRERNDPMATPERIQEIIEFVSLDAYTEDE